MYHHGRYNRPSPAVMLTRRVVLWVWPPAAMLVDADENLRGVVAFIVCSIANGILYGAVVFCLASGGKSLFKHRQINNFQLAASYRVRVFRSVVKRRGLTISITHG